MALAAIMMASCQKETADQNPDQALATSTDLNSTLGSTSADVSNVYDLDARHKPGKGIDFKRIPLDQLAQSIKDYVAANYANATIEFAAKDKAGNFYAIIKLADGSMKILLFDATGNFVKELDKKVPGPKHPKKHLTKVDPSNLLPGIVSYIDANYTGASILKAGSTPGGEFIVIISWHGGHKALLFDATGAFVKELK